VRSIEGGVGQDGKRPKIRPDLHDPRFDIFSLIFIRIKETHQQSIDHELSGTLQQPNKSGKFDDILHG